MNQPLHTIKIFMDFPQSSPGQDLTKLQKTIYVSMDDAFIHPSTLASEDVVALIDNNAKFLDTSGDDKNVDLCFVSLNDVINFYQDKPDRINLLNDLWKLKLKIDMNTELHSYRMKWAYAITLDA